MHTKGSSPGTPSGGGQVSHRLRSFFRMNSSSTNGTVTSEKGDKSGRHSPTDDVTTPSPAIGGAPGRAFRGRLFSSTVGRFRSQTVASEGNQIDEAMSPTAHANPYFAHQGLPGLRHHNEGSVPSSPPDTPPTLKVPGPADDKAAGKAASGTKEELARRLRRVASAPNAQGLFESKAGSKGTAAAEAPDRPATAELGKDPLVEDPTAPGSLAMVEAKVEAAKNLSLGPAGAEDSLASLPPPSNTMAFRRTYSSNSIKVRSVEVSPASFDKVKLIGKGDVGKVYLVREKKSHRLYAMKGKAASPSGL